MENNEMQHPDTVICRCCGEKRVKTFGKVGNDKRVIYVDEFGERWYGRKCPVCYKKYKVEYDRERLASLGVRELGSTDVCVDCGSGFLVKVGMVRRCPSCQGKYLQKERTNASLKK